MSIWKVYFTFAASNHKINTMKKNYLFPHYYQWIGLGIAVVAFVALMLGSFKDFSIRMPALYDGGIPFDDESNSGFFCTGNHLEN